MTSLPVVDAQVHVYLRDQPRQPWRRQGVVDGAPEVSGAAMAAAMDRVGIARAVLVSYFGPYGFDVGYALRVADTYPHRFRVVAPVDADRDGVHDVVAALGDEPNVSGLRLLMLSDVVAAQAAEGDFDPFFRAAREYGLPVSLMTWDTPALAPVVARYPDNLLVVDHLGLEQPHQPSDPRRGFDNLHHLVALGRHDNVRVKVSGMPTLSEQGYPFDDLWERLEQVLGAFGTRRCLWGSDWTRVADFATYDESIGWVRETHRLSDDEKQQLLATTAREVYGW